MAAQLTHNRKKTLYECILPQLYEHTNQTNELACCVNKITHVSRILFCLAYDEIIYLSGLHFNDDGESLTLLLSAVKHNFYDMVQVFVETYRMPVTHTGTLRFLNEGPIKKASALWSACANGNEKIVRLLVENGADVNMKTQTESTPIRPACYEGHLNIVAYLVEHGADINTCSIYYKNSNLMISCYRQRIEIVKYLLERNVDVNATDFRGRTALHIATEMGNLAMVQLLIRYGCDEKLPDNRGATPLQVACEYAREDIVEYLVKYVDMDTITMIEARELLGASFAQNQRNINTPKVMQYWTEATVMREQYGLPKTDLETSDELYSGIFEFRTIDDLKMLMIPANEELLLKQSYLVKDRIKKGITSSCCGVIFQGAIAADQRNYKKAILYWQKSLDIHRINRHRTVDDLTRLIDLMYKLKEDKPDEIESYQNHLYQILKDCCQALHSSMKIIHRHTKIHDLEMPAIDMALYKIPKHILSTLNLLLDENGLAQDAEWDLKIKKKIYFCCKVKLRFKKRDFPTFLHIACTANTDISSDLGKKWVSLPNLKLTKVLLDCGAKPNAVDMSQNTPLHMLTNTAQNGEMDSVSLSCAKILLKAGANPNYCNAVGNRPIQVCTRALQEFITLKGLAAITFATKVSYQSRLQLSKSLPGDLSDLILNCSQQSLTA